MPHHDSREMKSCIEACQSCETVCLETISHCLQLGGRHAEHSHIALMSACADICATSARVMAVGSDVHARVCQVCADICDLCAADCDALGGAEMKRCADECRKCADECRRMAQAGV
jgi:hypothetical protein